MSEEQENNAPRPRLILPGGAATDKPRTRLIAPATAVPEPEEIYEEIAQEEEQYVEEIAEEAPVAAIPHVTPLAPPPQQTEEEPDEDLGEAEQGEFTVINEDTGETHTVPVRVSSMAPPASEIQEESDSEPEASYAEPAQEEEAPDFGGYATYEDQQAAIAYEEAQQQAYYEQQQQARHPRLQVPQMVTHAEAPQYQQQQQPTQQFAQPQHQQYQGYPPQQQQTAFPPVGGYNPAHYPQAPGHHYPQIAASRGVPSWALILIGLLTGFIIAVILFKFTDFGPMLRPIKSMMK